MPIVEPSGLVVGMARRSYCHSEAKPLHPVVHLHILNRNGQIYLQQRSFTKDFLPGMWDTAVGGHVSYGESLTEALLRESTEELGFSKYNPIYICSYVFESAREKELVNVFAAVGSNFTLTPDKSELEQGRFWSEEEIDSHLSFDQDGNVQSDGVITPNFAQEFTALRKQLFSLL
ncbi:MAG: NUDIX domain-containing protein [Bacteroidales bacterium]|nr:NUDIX domain-containing protein [Bacteroidales bacterium]